MKNNNRQQKAKKGMGIMKMYQVSLWKNNSDGVAYVITEKYFTNLDSAKKFMNDNHQLVWQDVHKKEADYIEVVDECGNLYIKRKDELCETCKSRDEGCCPESPKYGFCYLHFVHSDMEYGFDEYDYGSCFYITEKELITD